MSISKNDNDETENKLLSTQAPLLSIEAEEGNHPDIFFKPFFEKS